LLSTKIKKYAGEYLPLIIILVGVAFVAFSLGPYQTYDTQLEFEAASNVVKTGIPYVKAYGTAIDQPPLGFYVEALFLKIFGLSADTGTALITIFGLASTVAVYLVGKELYGKSTGLFAAALFGLSPWQLVLSRSFLLDAQCLFFSILSLYVGFVAIRKGSVKLALVTGVVFSAALLTKLYAAFALIPLILFYIYSRPKTLKKILSQIAVFSMPSFVGAFLWYQVIRGVSILMILHHNDLKDVVPASTGVVSSPFFVTNFLLGYGLGPYFIAAFMFSLFIGFGFKKYFSKTIIVELILLASIIFVLSVNMILGAGLNLNVPYFSALKYCYQALPFFVLLAASLVAKGSSILKTAKLMDKPKKLTYCLVVSAALILIAASLVSSMYYTNVLSTRSYLQYRVEPQVDYGYAFDDLTPLTVGSPLMALQYLGFAVVLSGLLWASRGKLKWLFQREMPKWVKNV
jgi:4-amino-4-deoxy-L-arabinose transferase-like glycosyltransferase